MMEAARNNQHDLALGVEIGGTKLQVGLGNKDGEILLLRQGQVPTGADAVVIRDWLAQHISEFLTEAKKQGYAPISAMGVGFGGPVDASRGETLVSHQVAGWEHFPLQAWLHAQFPEMHIVIENDSNAAGWAEYCRGAGRGTRNFCYMNIGSGIGGALVLGGRLYNGQGLGAAEIGHTWIPDSLSEEAGAPVRLEDRCSGWAIERQVRAGMLPADSLLHSYCKGNTKQITCAMIAEAACAGDRGSLAIIDATARQLALALSNVVTLLHPERIALGGGVAHWGALLIDPLTTYLNELVFTPFQNTVEVLPCALEDKVVVIGALLLAMQPQNT